MAAGNQPIGGAIRRRREELKLTQAELAQLANVSRGTVRNAESGAITPNPTTWTSLEQALAWVPGSLSMVSDGNKPRPIFPAKAISPILHFVLNMAGSDPWTDPIRELTTLLSLGVDTTGTMTDDSIAKLFDLVARVAGDPDKADEITSNLEAELERTSSMRRVRHAQPDVGQRTDAEYGDDDMAEDPGPLLGLSPEVVKRLMESQVIDYAIARPEKTENLSVITLLVKDANESLTRMDRRYIGEPWDDLSEIIATGARLAKKPNKPAAKDSSFDDEPPF